MKIVSSLLSTLSAAMALSSGSAFALDTPSGPGMMHCDVVLKRLASPEAADRMPVLTWAQGYLLGIATVASAFDGTSDVEVPAYDDLQPRIVKLCKAEPTSDLARIARRLSATRARDR